MQHINNSQLCHNYFFNSRALRTLLVGYYALLFGLCITITYWYGVSKNVWPYGDFLINYQAGFVRRGLLGEFSFLLNRWFGVDPFWSYFISTAAAYTVSFYVIGRAILKYAFRVPWFSWCLISPLFIPAQVLDPANIGNKEQFLLACLAIHVLYLWSKKTIPYWLYVGLLASSCFMLTLAHEICIFFFPCQLMISYIVHQKYYPSISIKYTFFITCITTLLPMLGIINAPITADIPDIICNSWGSFVLPECYVDGKIAWLTHDLQSVLVLIAHRFLDDHYSVYFIACLLGGAPLAILFLRFNQLDQNKYFSMPWMKLFFLGSIILPLILFRIAMDWGRFLHIAIASYFFVYLACLHTLDDKLPLSDGIQEQIQDLLSSFSSVKLRQGLIGMAFIIYGFFWGVSQYSGDFFEGYMYRVKPLNEYHFLNKLLDR